MSLQVPKCCWTTLKNKECSFKGTIEYCGKYYCKKHLTVMKAHEECSICLCDMGDKKDTAQLACGHFFHVRCLSQCQKAVCPLCRTQFSPVECYRIFKSTVIKPIAHSVFAFSCNCHGLIFSMYRSIVSISGRGNWYLETLYTIIIAFENLAKNAEYKDEFLRVLHDLSLQIQQNF